MQKLGHATPDDLAAEVDDVDVATVYRTLELLEDLGFVAHAHFGHGAPSYRPSHDGHVHLVCHRCGRVMDQDVTVVEPLARRLSKDADFTVDVDHFTIFGRCGPCEREQTGTDPR